MTRDTFVLDIHDGGKIHATWTYEDPEYFQTNNKNPSMSRNGSLDQSEFLVQHISYFSARLQRRRLHDDEEGLKLLGTDLYQALFTSEVRGLFEEAERKVSDAVQRGETRSLSIYINVDPHYDVAGWPLEFLRCPTGGGFWLCAEKRHVALSRRLDFPQQSPRQPPRSPPLQVLVVISTPPSLKGVLTKAVEYIAEWAKVTAPIPTSPTAQRAKAKRAVNIRLLGILADYEPGRDVNGVEYLAKPATYDNFGSEIRDKRPHVLHFIGHGKLDVNTHGYEKGSLAFIPPEPSDVDRDKVDWRPSGEVASPFNDWKPALVVLQACETAASAVGPSQAVTTGRGFMSLAADLMQKEIPAIVAMQFEIRNEHATKFAAGFYRALADGRDIDAAVRQGRWQITQKDEAGWRTPYFGTPALFVVDADPFGLIIPSPSTAETILKAIPRRRPSRLDETGNTSLRHPEFLDKEYAAMTRGDEERAQDYLRRAAGLKGGRKARPTLPTPLAVRPPRV